MIPLDHVAEWLRRNHGIARCSPAREVAHALFSCDDLAAFRRDYFLSANPQL